MRLHPLLLSLLLLPSPGMASTYQALCGSVACTISLDASGPSSPEGFMPTPRIAQWFTGGQESYNAGSGTAGALGGATAGAIGGALLLGPIGLLGGLIGGGLAGSKAGRSADLFFNVVGYDQEGRKTTASFRFINSKPANQLRMELPMFTGLAMGQTRPLAELQAALGSGAAPAPVVLPERLTPGPSAGPASKPANTIPTTALPDRLNAGTSSPAAATPPDQAWLDYLQQRNLVNWARNNPQLADQLRRRMFPQSEGAN